MTVRYIAKATNASAAADTAAPYANTSGSVPTGVLGRTDLVLLCSMNKPYSTTPSIADAEWNAIGTHTNGTTANGVDAGSCRVNAWWYEPSPDIETNVGAPSIAFDGAYSPVIHQGLHFAATDGDTWDVSYATGADTDESSTAVSVTADSVVGFTVGDRVVVVLGFNSDTAAITSGAISATGATFGTLTQRVATPGNASGNDGSLYVYEAEVTAGTATGALVFTGTAASAAQSGCAALIIRLHRTGTSIDFYTRDFTDTATAGVALGSSYDVFLHAMGDNTPDAESYYSDLSLTGTSTTIATRTIRLTATPDDECVYDVLWKATPELFSCEIFALYDEADAVVFTLEADSNGGQINVKNSAGTTLGWTKTALNTTTWVRLAVKHKISTKTITVRTYTGENLDSDNYTEEASFTYATSPGYPRRFTMGFQSNKASTVIYWNRLRVTKAWASAPNVALYDPAYVRYFKDSLDTAYRTGSNPIVADNSGSPRTITMPAGIAADMLGILYVLHSHSTASSVTTPSGWTLEGSQFVEIGAIDYTLYMYSKVLTGSETTISVVHSPTTNGLYCWIEVYQNVNVVDGPWDVSPTFATSAAAATYTPTSITTTSAYSLALAVFATVDDNLLKLDTEANALDFSVRVNMNAIAGNDAAMMTAVKSIPVAGSVTMPTATQSQNGNDAWLSITAALLSETGAVLYERTIDDALGLTDSIVQEEQNLYERTIDDDTGLSDSIVSAEAEQEAGSVTDTIGIEEDAVETRTVRDTYDDTLGLTDEITVETVVANVFTGWGIPTSHP